MDKMITSNAKAMATTPFSINDILTKNNTTIFRRRISSGELSPMSQSNDNVSDHGDFQANEELSCKLSKTMKIFKNPTIEQFHQKAQFDRHSEYRELERVNAVQQSKETPTDEYFSEHGNSSSPLYKKIHQSSGQIFNNNNNIDKSIGKSEDKNFTKRRGSLDCFLIDGSHNYTDREVNLCNRVDRKAPISTTDHLMKVGYYNYPIVVESPLDMRRCANDSGKRKVHLAFIFISFHFILRRQ